MQKGYLRTEVYIAREGAPAVAALVRVYIDNVQYLLQYTDASGATPDIELDAPDAELSRDPNYEGAVYSVCDVEVEFARYKPVRVSGVMIFAGQTTIQPIFLDPATLGPGVPDRDRIRLVNIPEHKLLGSAPANLDPPPDPYNSRILEFVAIPNYVTVHLGTPTSDAQDVTVTFSNYIKNVCSSEIYPTWPENSIRANIYCQISLVLNRIFTEWYRSRGYNYDITNSTSYDQYFVYGRNIFENISRIVDEIFNVYIRRGTSKEPFYAEYCNGTTVTCPGLSQWGTVSLANQGYTPLQILRYYYGNTVALYEAPFVDQTIESYPGTALRFGSTGSSVAIIQEQLNRIRRNYPLIPSAGAVDGVFGAGTQAAVRTFQSIFNLTVDGIVGKATWYRISYIYTAVTKLAELGSEGITTPNLVTPVPSAVLSVGSRGSLVSLAQYLLDVAADTYDGLYPVAIDGVYGPNTYNAVYYFQQQRGIRADGVIGSITWNELYKTFYSALNAITPVGSTAYPGTALRVGSTGSSVSLIQRYLNYISSFFEGIDQVTIDGIFGNATRAAVVAFQRTFGLAADGVVGPATWNRIVAVYDTVVTYQ